MVNKKSKWSPEEDMYLKQLKATQLQANEIKWEKISIQLNQKCNGDKTSKQCRQRYVNYIKFADNNSLIYEWSNEELEKLIDLYIQYGASWTYICTKLPNKSENCIKNKFHNALRKSANTLHEIEVKNLNNKKRSIDLNLLIAMVDLVSQANNLIRSLGYTPNQNSALFKFRLNILKLCFKKDVFTDEELFEIVKQIKSLNVKLRCFGMFKVKNRKSWKISVKSLQAILNFDDIIIEQNVKLTEEMNQPTHEQKIELEQNSEEIFQRLKIENCNVDIEDIFLNKAGTSRVQSGDLLIQADEIMGISISLISPHCIQLLKF